MGPIKELIVKELAEKYAKSITFALGEEVYLKTDPDQHMRIVSGIVIRQDGNRYNLEHGITDSWHYDFEISREKNIVKSTSE